MDDPLLHNLADRRILRFQRLRGCGHRKGLALFSDAQHQIEAHLLANLERHFPRECGEAGSFHMHRSSARAQGPLRRKTLRHSWCRFVPHQYLSPAPLLWRLQPESAMDPRRLPLIVPKLAWPNRAAVSVDATDNSEANLASIALQQ